MKREDAIWILELIRNRDARTDAEKDAVNAAIEALKAQLFCEGTTEGTASDTISRQWLLECVDEGWIKFDTDKDANRFIHLVRDIAPSAQPEPQEGHWIRTDCGLDVECKCSKCGYRDFVEPRDEYWFKRNYCPNCGAKMKGAQNG